MKQHFVILFIIIPAFCFAQKSSQSKTQLPFDTTITNQLKFRCIGRGGVAEALLLLAIMKTSNYIIWAAQVVVFGKQLMQVQTGQIFQMDILVALSAMLL